MYVHESFKEWCSTRYCTCTVQYHFNALARASEQGSAFVGKTFARAYIIADTSRSSHLPFIWVLRYPFAETHVHTVPSVINLHLASSRVHL